MENKKKIDPLFGVVVIALLVAIIFLVGDLNSKMFNDEKEYRANLGALIKIKNEKIQILSRQLAQKQGEYDSLQKTLLETRNNLELLSKKLTDLSTPPAAVPAAAPVAAPEAAPAAVPQAAAK
ncbi:MAG: hypothetical protein HQL14_05405 [Candidatus Omnitrophica bacterium]|nr:hypothetical protein [Candidatus Omnitrophota bacterium]